MLYAAIDIHKHAFQAAVLDSESGEVVEERFSADRESLARWAERWRGRVAAVAIEEGRPCARKLVRTTSLLDFHDAVAASNRQPSAALANNATTPHQ